MRAAVLFQHRTALEGQGRDVEAQLMRQHNELAERLETRGGAADEIRMIPTDDDDDSDQLAATASTKSVSPVP